MFIGTIFLSAHIRVELICNLIFLCLLVFHRFSEIICSRNLQESIDSAGRILGTLHSLGHGSCWRFSCRKNVEGINRTLTSTNDFAFADVGEYSSEKYLSCMLHQLQISVQTDWNCYGTEQYLSNTYVQKLASLFHCF